MDTKTLTTEYNKYLPMVHWVLNKCGKKFPSHIQRDDLISAAQEALIFALQQSKNANEKAFRSYIVDRIRGAIIEEVRRHDFLPRHRGVGERRSISYDEQIFDTLLDEKTPLQDEPSINLPEAFKYLLPRDADVIRLHYLEGVQFSDIAKQFGVTGGRIAHIHKHALEKLREFLSA